RSVFNEFAMLVQVEGSCEVKRGRRTTVTRPGETLLVGGNHDVDLGYDADFKQVVIQLPRALVFRQYEWLRDMDGVVLSAEDPAGQLLRYSLTGLAAVIRQLTPEQRLHAVSGLMAQLGVIGPERTPAAAPELFDRALALIKTHLSDPDVSPERLAGALQVKRRTLDAAFAGRGESVMKTVWDQRLDRAAELLAGGTTRSVTDVALALGFSSLPHFSRVFKKRFGVSPSRYARPMR
ncbi:MAG: helix-turn-helix domain-containing protein, partial [Myxococcota bacterium]